MLSESSYSAALIIYIGAASALLLYLGWILSRYWRSAWVALVVLLSAALLLTPAYPSAEISTLAPALLVAVFEGLINGPEAARHAVKPLLFMMGLALAISIVLRFTLFRSRRDT